MGDRDVSPEQVASAPEARLYYLLPGDPGAQIQLVSEVCLLDATTYLYISFRGLDAYMTAIISVDGEEKYFPEAHAVFLRGIVCSAAGRLGPDIMFWADGLDELTWEELMDDRQHNPPGIIEHSIETCCVLGAPQSAASAEKAVDTLNCARGHWNDACASVGATTDGSLFHLTVQQKLGISKWLRDHGSEDLEKTDESVWAGIEAIFLSAYWNSVECIAEIVLSRDVRMIWGDYYMTYETYICAFRALTYLRHEKIPLKPCSVMGWQVAIACCNMRYVHQQSGGVDLRRMLQIARLCPSASNLHPKVMIATMLSFSKPWGRCPIPPSITFSSVASVEQFFIDTARYIILDRQDLSIWDQERPPCTKRINGIPTWVPDFSADAAQRGVQFPVRTGLQVWGDYFMRAHKNIRISNENHLIVQARGIDNIKRFSPIFNAWNAARICLDLYENLQSPMNEPQILWFALVDRL
ncbi:hypothetical protein F5B21DRAFT_501841 [Xylaria acuta]|nr:hypothetical protein F5B21DRAFT_501841 [Xylaria acuta]